MSCTVNITHCTLQHTLVWNTWQQHRKCYVTASLYVIQLWQMSISSCTKVCGIICTTSRHWTAAAPLQTLVLMAWRPELRKSIEILCSLHQFSRYNLKYATTISYQILSNPPFINHKNTCAHFSKTLASSEIQFTKNNRVLICKGRHWCTHGGPNTTQHFVQAEVISTVGSSTPQPILINKYQL